MAWASHTTSPQSGLTPIAGRKTVRSLFDDAERVLEAATDKFTFRSIANDVEIFVGGNYRSDRAIAFPFGEFWSEARDIKGHPSSRGDVEIATMSRVAMAPWSPRMCLRLRSSLIIPPKLFRRRFEDQIIERFLAIRWWDWPDEVRAKCPSELHYEGVEGLLDAAEAMEE